MTPIAEAERFIWTDWTLLPKKPRAAGGPGSGNFGHAGRPGEVGGSAPKNGTPDNPSDSIDVETAEDGGSWYVTHWSDDKNRQFTTERHAYFHPTAEFDPHNLGGAKGALIFGVVTLKHPKVVSSDESVDMTKAGVAKLKAQGYDGAINEEGWELIAFSPGESFTENERRLDSYPAGYEFKGLGGPGSGNFGHAGRPGQVGGSASGSLNARETELLDSWRTGEALSYDDMRNPNHPLGAKMTRLLKKMPVYEDTAYRGVVLDDNDLAKLKKAKTFTLDMHSSASQDGEVADQFLDQNELAEGWNKVRMEFRNSNAANITGEGTQNTDWEEVEVVVMAGTKWRQVEIVEDGDHTRIILEPIR